MTIFIKKLILITLFLAACQSTFPDQVSPINTAPLPSTPIETFTPVKSLQVIPSVASTPFDQNPRVIGVPEWARFSFPGGILALAYGDATNSHPSKSMLVNPDNGETFIVDLQKDFYHYYWIDNEHIVFFHEGDCGGFPEFISELSVFTGLLQTYGIENYSKSILGCYPNPNDGLVRLNYGFSERAVEFVDRSSGAVSLLTNPNDGVTDISVELSPHNDFAAVIQFDGEFEFPQSSMPIYGNKISIFDLTSQRIILQYTEEQGILSEVSFVNDANLAYMRENTPCLIMISSQLKKCIHNIPNRFPDSTIMLSENSHEDATLRFLHFTQQQGDYCFYNISTGGLGCPTDRFFAFHNQIIINYSLSSFGHYLLVEYDSKGCPVPWCDYREKPQIGVIDFYEGELFELGDSDSFWISEIFRPVHPDPWQPWR
jgi:hypothetical protein